MATKGGWSREGYEGYASRTVQKQMFWFITNFRDVVLDIESYPCPHCLVKEGEPCRTFSTKFITYWHASRRKLSKYYDGRGNLRANIVGKDRKEVKMTDLELFEESFHEWLQRHGVTVRTGEYAIDHNLLKIGILGIATQMNFGPTKPVAVLHRAEDHAPSWMKRAYAEGVALSQNPTADKILLRDIADAVVRRLDLLESINTDQAMQLLVWLSGAEPKSFDDAVKSQL